MLNMLLKNRGYAKKNTTINFSLIELECVSKNDNNFLNNMFYKRVCST